MAILDQDGKLSPPLVKASNPPTIPGFTNLEGLSPRKGHLRGEPEGQRSTLWKGNTYAQGGIPLRGGDRPGGLWHRHLLSEVSLSAGEGRSFLVSPLRCQRQLPPQLVPFEVKGWERGEPSLSPLQVTVSPFLLSPFRRGPSGWWVGCAKEELSPQTNLFV